MGEDSFVLGWLAHYSLLDREGATGGGELVVTAMA
jgi:hypothetical protein